MLVQYFRRGGIKRMRERVVEHQPIEAAELVVKERGMGGGIRRGLFIAVHNNDIFNQDGVLRFGWSLCNVKAGDIFNEGLAKSIAIGRANAQKSQRLEDFPPSMQKKAKRFMARAKAYFKVNDPV